MEILYITKTSPLSDGGGGEERARQVTSGLASRGHSVTILSGKTDPELSKWSTFDGCEVRHVGCVPSPLFRFPKLSFYASRYLFALTSLPVLLWILVNRDIDVVSENMTPYPSLSIVLAKLTGTPIVAVQHEFYDRSCYRTYDPVTATIQLVVQNILRVGNYAKIIVPTTHVANQLTEYGVAQSQLVVVHNGVDAERYEQTNLDRDTDALITVGRLSKRKGQDLLLKAFQEIQAKAPATHLHILGKGPARGDLESLAKRLDIEDSITFHGYVDGERKVELLNRSGIFVFASRQEGFGLVLLEAMAAGLPVVATSLPVYEDFFKDRMHGRLLQSKDSSVFASATLEILADKERTKHMRAANRQAAKQFSWDATIEKTERVLREVTDTV